MVKYLTQDLIHHLIIFQSVILLILLSNIYLSHRARHHRKPVSYPEVSILVPARNEENSISDCLQSLLTQNYPSFEVLVLDDKSTDKTRSILSKMAQSYPELIVLDGDSPPENQVGKNWACSQLAIQSKGNLLLFTDADTRHHPDMLTEVVTALIGEEADLLTGFPHQNLGSWGERFLVPFFSWAALSFIPLALAYHLRVPALSSAVGQMMLFRREAYLKIGGHSRVSSSVVDDLSLARTIKRKGLRWRVVYIADQISCRMYRTSKEAFQGFSKNLFAAFDFRLLPYLFVFGWLGVMFWLPLIILAFMFLGWAPLAQPFSLLGCISLSAILWIIAYHYLRLPSGLALLYPITIIVNSLAAIQSIRHSITGKLSWKGRELPITKWNWL